MNRSRHVNDKHATIKATAAGLLECLQPQTHPLSEIGITLTCMGMRELEVSKYKD